MKETPARTPTTPRPLYDTIATLASNWTQSIADIAIETGWQWRRVGDSIMWRKHLSGPVNPDDGKWQP
jgi:hypothetical protein